MANTTRSFLKYTLRWTAWGLTYLVVWPLATLALLVIMAPWLVDGKILRQTRMGDIVDAAYEPLCELWWVLAAVYAGLALLTGRYPGRGLKKTRDT